ncbi:YlxR family protein [Arthrobacter echini]|uniref:YlxR family protein n=1 Tax=Arthrobacter echini TaxID=1529066 RepID=A0A5D0XRI3_9MICC|nr:YlxR family protein [Arthrobacter echini]TYC99098.1 YlxR family protein [Arthrobacter echini]
MEPTAVELCPEELGRRQEDTQPRRTCVGCRLRDRQSHVIRIVARPIDGQLAAVIDERRRLSGRGAWLHPDPACLDTAVKRRAFNRAFRGPVDTAQFAVDFRAYLERRDGRSDPPSPSLKAGQHPHGNPMSTQR